MPASVKPVDPEALSKLIGDSGILNPNVKVADLLSVATKADGLAGTGMQSDIYDCFIHGGFVYIAAK